MSIRRFIPSRSGNVSMFFALSIIPMFGMVGFSIDYTRASNARSKILSAVDAAAINGNRTPNLSLAEKTTIVKNVIASQLADSPWISYQSSNIIVADTNGVLDVAISATVKTTFASIIGVSTLNVSVSGQSINRIEDGAEIALVLDNTGSMRNDMDALKTASKNFINTIMPNSGGQVKIGIVPYVAAVNPGPAAMNGHMDYNAESTHHAQLFENWAYVSSAPCEYPPNDDDGGGDDGGGGDPPFDPGKGGTEGGSASLDGWMDKLAGLLTISSAEANGGGSAVTPNTAAPFQTNTAHVNPPHVLKKVTVKVPKGFKFNAGGGGDCALWNPDTISHFDLFDRIPGATWKGCVEARPEPYDVTDAAPANSDKNTRFVPYFWPDEPSGSNNDFINDFPAVDPLKPLGFNNMEWIGRQDKTQGILKYNGTNNGGTVAIDEVGTETKGPNKSCPDPIVPLTTATNDLVNAIDALTYKENGGTINSEGLMWGWRVLSPTAPFTEGSAYGATKKYLVLMSDGKNEMLDNPIDDNVMYSDYSAYGYLAKYETRLSMGTQGIWQGSKVRTFTEATKYLDGRFKQACANIKAQGITVFTVLFRENDANAKKLMEECATSGKYFYYAKDQAALGAAFGQLGQQLQNLRLTK